MTRTAYYTGIASFHEYPDGKGEYAKVFCTDHYVLGLNVDVITSRVVRKFENGFETLNTIYLQRSEEE